MSILVNIGAVAVGLILIVTVIRLIVKRGMSESQAVLWLLIGAAAVILGIFPDLIPWLAVKLGIWYAPSILLIAACAGLVLIAFYHSTGITKNTSQLHELEIQLVLLKNSNEELKKELEAVKRERRGE